MGRLVSHYYVNHIPGNNPAEDSHATLAGSKGALFGVYDGHGGRGTSQYLQDVLLTFIDLHLKTPLTERVTERLKSAFRLADKTFFKTRWNTNLASDVYSGACACVGYVTGDGYAYVANAGDSSGFIGSRMMDGKWMPRAIARRHTLDNPTERRALLEAHPNEPDVDALDRVKGVLQPTRGFGDGRLKFKEINAVHPEPFEEPFTPPYIHSEPDVTRIHLHPHRDRFLLLATDGLWDLVAPHTVAGLIGKHIDTPGINLASVAIHAALSNVGLDWSLDRMAEVPPEVRREIHDDITVTVVVFRDPNTVQRERDEENKQDCIATHVPTAKDEMSRLGEDFKEVFAAAEEELPAMRRGMAHRRRVRMSA